MLGCLEGPMKLPFLIAVLTLAALVGGLGEWIWFYRMFVQKSATLSYPHYLILFVS